MLSVLVRIAQLVEGALYALLCYLLVRSGWSIPAAVVAGLALPFASRLALVGITIALSAMNASPRGAGERIGAAAAVRMALREWRSLLALNLLYVPWEARLLRPDPVPAAGAGVPVMLVHGYFANRGFFVPLVRRLERAGVRSLFVPTMRSCFATIEDFEADLAEAIERISRLAGRPVMVIAHSMGGLGLRAYLANRGSAQVCRMVTLGSPHHGTALARFGAGANARQMCRGSRFLAELERREGAGPGIPALSVYSSHDNMVAPQETSRLPWARNVALAGFGHIELAHCDEVIALLLEELHAAGAVPAP